jgi:RNA polymerase sigma factor (sigma-70 family)
MSEKEFKKLVDGFKPNLKRLCVKNRFLGFIDKDDLYQEALINLWSRYEQGELQDKTESYILRSCYFHIQNYIRTHKVRNNTVSLEEPLAPGEGGAFFLKDMIKDENGFSLGQADSRLVINEILNNGLTKREHDVFRLLYEGWNLREVAQKLGISHVRVLKIKQNINHKYGPRYQETL